jgi:hypothetical protein
MASTRNINTRGNYNLEQEHYNLGRENILYIHNPQGKAYINSMPSVGYMPNRMPRDTLSSNPIEIESMLFGINSTNLVKPRKPIKPQLKAIPTLNFFDRLPTHLPKPLVVENNQRPYPI